MAETVIAASMTLDAGQATKSVKEFKDELKQAERDYSILKETVGETNTATLKAAENISKIKDQINIASESAKGFKTKLREAQENLVKIQAQFGATSKEALAAAKGVANMRDQMQEAKEVSDLFDPGAKFQVFGNVLRTVAGGFSALTGTMALFGADSKEIEKQILKVQAALAITEGVNTIVDSAKDFDRLKAVIMQTSVVQKVYAASTALTTTVMKALGLSTVTTSGGFKLLRGALIATGVGALVVALGLLIANFDKVKKFIINLIPGLSGMADFVLKITNNITDFVGITSEAGRQMERTIRGLEGAIKSSEQFLDLNADKYDQYTKRKIDADLDYKRKKLEFLKDEKLTEEQKNNLIAQAEAQRTRLIRAASSDRATAEKEISDAASKKFSDAAKQALEQQKAANDQANADLRTLKQENYLASIEDDRKRAEEKIRIDFENNKRQIDGLKIAEDIKTDLIKQQEIKRDNELKAVKVDFDLKDIEARKEKDEKINATLQAQYDAQLAIIKENEAKIQNALQEDVLDGSVSPEDTLALELEIKRTALQAEYDLTSAYGYSTSELKGQLLQMDLDAQKDATEKKIAYDEAEKASKMQLYSAIGSGFGALAGLLGEGTKAAKAAALAEIAIGTGVGFIQGLDIAQKSAKATGPAAAFAFPIFYATQIAAVLGAASRAKSILKAGSSVSGPSMPNVSVAAPLRPQAQVQQTSTRLDQQSINNMGSAASPVRAFIVEKDVENNRERITRLNRAARLGG